MPESWELPLFNNLLFHYLYLPVFILFTLYLPTLLTPMHNKNISFLGRQKSVDVTAGWNISDFQILTTFITGILNFLSRNPRKLGIFSLNSSPFLTSCVQDVVGLEDWDVSVPLKKNLWHQLIKGREMMPNTCATAKIQVYSFFPCSVDEI